MLTTIALELGYEFTVKANVADVFNVLADVPTSASFYPGVDQLVDLGGNTYRWEMEKIGLPHLTLQTVYASRYTSNKAKGIVSWTPVQGEGNARVTGSWKISAAKPGTHVVLAVQAELDLPLPAMMKPVLHPLVEAEFERLTERYIDNLIERFGGEV